MSIHRTRINPHLGDRAELCQWIIEEHRTQTYTSGNNFPLRADRYANACAAIYQSFVLEARRLLGRFQIHPESHSTCWAYVSNESEYRGGRHHHLRTSTINGVYYLRVPAVPPGETDVGALHFFDADGQRFQSIRPAQDDLLIFPNYLVHEPGRIASSEYRIAINVEIICDYRWRR